MRKARKFEFLQNWMNEKGTLKWKLVNKVHCIAMVKKKQNKKNANFLLWSVSHPSYEKNTAKLVTILKLCERSFKWDLARMKTGSQKIEIHGETPL